MTDMERDAGLYAPFPYQHLIRIAVRAPEPEVAMQHFEGTAGPQEQVGHAHGVHAAADSRLMQVQRAMEDEMKRIRVSDVADDIRSRIQAQEA